MTVDEAIQKIAEEVSAEYRTLFKPFEGRDNVEVVVKRSDAIQVRVEIDGVVAFTGFTKTLAVGGG